MPSLPQLDPDPAGREAQIEAQRAEYEWDHDFLAPLSVLKERGTPHPDDYQAVLGWTVGIVPKDTHPPLKYLVERPLSLLPLKLNADRSRGVWERPAFASLDDYKALFVLLPRPSTLPDWPSDARFAWERVGGVNPVVLQAIAAVPSHFAVDEARLAGLLPNGATLVGLGEQGRLFLCDFAMLEGIPIGPFTGGAKCLTPSMGLFWVDESSALKALAVQIGQEPVPETVLTPLSNPKAWLLAKTYFQVADINHHEMGTHLCRTHFILEGFAVAASRQLSERHPVAVLLKPHLRILIWNNFEGRELLLAPNGLATRLLAGGLAGSSEILKRSYAGYAPPPLAGLPRAAVPAWSFEDWDLPRALKARGVADPAKLPDYPYRDDGLLVWQAIYEFVGAYLRIYYGSDADVRADAEVQAWVAELQSPAGAHVRDISAPQSIDDLVTLLTRILFTCGPQHAAVNFSQYDSAASALTMPASAYAPPPANAQSLPDADLDAFLLRMLPPPAQAELQVRTVTELTSYRFDRLGHYQDQDFTDPKALAVIAEFQGKLNAVQATIASRNGTRAIPYPWFSPDRIPNSTSI